eukprot:CAMPEP_0175973298 /NCGR_PEP_ID=MMETSP0108-20121206/42712_1 /TAXON_ID=195067 ORGANISM="Goniomonas pacifica, Strain CCMP1869" /NCGR_SAMPLE_ID=MMETSP0108 /ASSEMBLY_ACC=CAM_ASM_000204 /LENGTH=62 /DNA_ID=CAMNT_0017302721 /DNA_START=28 /DNA_END=216 /DNA_ORIENTATION=-
MPTTAKASCNPNINARAANLCAADRECDAARVRAAGMTTDSWKMQDMTQGPAQKQITKLRNE